MRSRESTLARSTTAAAAHWLGQRGLASGRRHQKHGALHADVDRTHNARVRVDTPDVCLIDIGLPEIDGNKLAPELRRLPRTANAMLIAVTGYGQAEYRRNTLSEGYDHHLVKPVDTRKLASILAHVKSD